MQERPRVSTETLGEPGYRLFIVLAFLLWTLTILVLSIQVQIDVDELELVTTVQVAAALSAVSIGLIPVIHSLNSGERFLKCALAVLSVFFVSAAITGEVGMVQEPTNFATQGHIDVFAVAVLGIAPLVYLGTERLLRRLGWARHLVIPVCIPLFATVSASGELLPIASILLLLGATITLAALSFVFVAYLLVFPRGRAPADDSQADDALNDCLAILNDIRDYQLRSGLLDSDQLFGDGLLVSHADLQSRLTVQCRNKGLDDSGDRAIRIDQVVQDAIYRLRNLTTRVFHEGSRFYVAPSQEDVSRCLQSLESYYLVVVWPAIEESRSASTGLLSGFAALIHFPRPVIREFVWPACKLTLERRRLVSTVSVNFEQDSDRRVVLNFYGMDGAELALLASLLQSRYGDCCDVDGGSPEVTVGGFRTSADSASVFASEEIDAFSALSIPSYGPLDRAIDTLLEHVFPPGLQPVKWTDESGQCIRRAIYKLAERNTSES